ncbi:40S ribosomal protein S0 [Enterospora canceri]|uniref:Small ribosomal subunit protein uS2 n=1 Tax=Enterospora canceri TaxID=1081671 RepID=A0A1Y1SAB9_9MICR|nr:40S ribosomal protein S0 [Enterospora canceri]
MPNEFVKLLVVTQAHLGGVKVTKPMKKYIYGLRKDKIPVFDLKKTWEKFVLAARAICGLTHADDITVISCKTFGKKPVMKFTEAVGCKAYTGRFMPGSFTNTTIKNSCEPRLIVVSDPIVDKQAVGEAARVNCPTIAFCNTDCDLKNVDIAIPLNNRSPRAIGACFFILSRLVKYIKYGAKMEEDLKEVELFFYRDAAELERLQEEQNEGTENDLIKNIKTNIVDQEDFGKKKAEVGNW